MHETDVTLRGGWTKHRDTVFRWAWLIAWLALLSTPSCYTEVYDFEPWWSFPAVSHHFSTRVMGRWFMDGGDSFIRLIGPGFSNKPTPCSVDFRSSSILVWTTMCAWLCPFVVTTSVNLMIVAYGPTVRDKIVPPSREARWMAQWTNRGILKISIAVARGPIFAPIYRRSHHRCRWRSADWTGEVDYVLTRACS